MAQPTESLNEARLTTAAEAIDRVALKLALVEDNFDNARTREEYERSARGNLPNVFAVRVGEIVGNARLLSKGVCKAHIPEVLTRSDLLRRGIGHEQVTYYQQRGRSNTFTYSRINDQVLNFAISWL